MPQKWTEEEKARLGVFASEIPTNLLPQLSNRELQQAIRETFEMWAKTDPPEGDNLEKHLNTLLNLQLIRARGGYVDQ